MANATCHCGRAIVQPQRGRPRKRCAICGPRRTDQPPKEPVDRACSVCGCKFTTTLGATHCRSEKCKWLARVKKPCTQCGCPTGYAASDNRVTNPICRSCRRERKKPTTRSVTSWKCQYCGKQCLRPPTKGQIPRYCSKKHEQMAGFLRRRARRKNAFVEEVSRIEVFIADGFRCHLCGRKTNPNKTVPHKRAPTVDHIVPLAKGGMHERSNCRTACFSCNSRKRDRGGGEQLLLIG